MSSSTSKKSLRNTFKVVKVGGDNFYAQYEIGPLESGYGNTLLNPLRRVLISKIKGTSITEVRIKGAEHEFMTLPGVKNDLLIVIMNLKKVVFRLIGSEKETVRLKAKGVGVVKASDIETPGNVTVMNPDLVITELTSPDAKLDIEVTVEAGYGFELRDDEIRNTKPGVIPVNKAFSPVIKVNYDVKPTRVGSSMDYEKAILEIWTNGAVTPDEALDEAVRLIISEFEMLKEALL